MDALASGNFGDLAAFQHEDRITVDVQFEGAFCTEFRIEAAQHLAGDAMSNHDEPIMWTEGPQPITEASLDVVIALAARRAKVPIGVRRTFDLQGPTLFY